MEFLVDVLSGSGIQLTRQSFMNNLCGWISYPVACFIRFNAALICKLADVLTAINSCWFHFSKTFTVCRCLLFPEKKNCAVESPNYRDLNPAVSF